MTTTLTIALATLLLSPGAWKSSAMARYQSDASINSIRQHYATINKRAARYKKVKKQLSGFSLEGGQLVAYFDGPAIVKIVATHYGEMGRTVEEYYYSSGRLVFAFEKVFNYNKPMSGKVIRTSENRFYFKDDQLLRWIGETEKQVYPGSEGFRSKQNDILENSNRFIAGAQSKNPTIER